MAEQVVQDIQTRLKEGTGGEESKMETKTPDEEALDAQLQAKRKQLEEYKTSRAALEEEVSALAERKRRKTEARRQAEDEDMKSTQEVRDAVRAPNETVGTSQATPGGTPDPAHS